jgi:ketosteroid isomerase-like protein
MSSVNADLLRRWIWAFEHDADTFVALAHPAIEWAPFEQNHTVFRGVDEALGIRSGWLDTWAEHRIALEEMIDGGDEFVVAMHLTARGRESGIEVDVRLYPHVKLRDGKVAYVYEHEDRAQALRASGLEG